MRGMIRECVLVALLATVMVSMALGTLSFSSAEVAWTCQALGAGAADFGWTRRTLELMATALTFGFCDSPITRGSIVAGTLRAALTTAQLVLAAIILVVLIAVPLGVRAATHAGSRVTRAVRGGFDVVSGLPVLFWCTLTFMVMARACDIIPGSEGHAVITAVVAVASLVSGDRLLSDLVQLVELATQDIRAEPYMRTVRAGGFGVSRHLLQSLVPPVATAVMARAMLLISGAIVAELLFDLPGLGALIRESLGRANPAPKVALAASLALIGFGLVFRALSRTAEHLADGRPAR